MKMINNMFISYCKLLLGKGDQNIFVSSDGYDFIVTIKKIDKPDAIRGLEFTSCIIDEIGNEKQ